MQGGIDLKNSFLWILICIVCLFILMGAGRIILKHLTLMSDSFSNATTILKDNDYISWEEKLIRETQEEIAIFIDINSKTLEVINLKDNDIIKKYIIASGKKETPSPIGSFKIINKGKWGKGFGTRWMGLNVP